MRPLVGISIRCTWMLCALATVSGCGIGSSGDHRTPTPDATAFVVVQRYDTPGGAVESLRRMQAWLDDNFGDTDWAPLADPPLDALDLNRHIERVRESPCDERARYIAIGGGLICSGDYLVVTEQNGLSVEVRSAEALSTMFAPVTSAGEAAAFASVVRESVYVQGVASAGADFLVWAIEPHFFGCGPHRPTAVVFRVSDQGKVDEVKAQPEPRSDPATPVLCTD